MNGSDYERKLARYLDGRGFHVIRAPSSGAATERELPDLMWSKRGVPTIAGELKATSQNVAYYDKEEVQALTRFANAFGAEARLIARYKGDTSYYMFWPADARETDSGRYAVDRDIEHAEMKA